jgi:hypothetical protein
VPAGQEAIMSGTLYSTPFQPISNSSGPSFNIGATSSGLYALESTSLNRVWSYPSGRTVRIASIGADDFYFKLGSSTIDIGSSDGTLVLGGTVELFRVQPAQQYIVFKSSTDVTFNVTLGVGQ